MYKEQMDVELYLLHVGFLDNEEIFKKKLRQVSTQRQEKVLKNKIWADRKRSLGAGLLLEQILGERGYGADEIAVGESGKLYLSDVDDFFFSISHSGDYAACVISDVPVGVDIQQKRETKAHIARRFFQQSEAEMIEKTPEEKRDELFFRFWTGKESYLKMKGRGISDGMDSFFVNLDEMRIVDKYNPEEMIYLKEYKCLEDYYISVACYSSRFSALVKKIYYRL